LGGQRISAISSRSSLARRSPSGLAWPRPRRAMSRGVPRRVRCTRLCTITSRPFAVTCRACVTGLLVAATTVAGVVTAMALSPVHADGTSAATVVTKIPSGYRDWRLISVAREEGSLNDIRAVLGNDAAIKAYREGKLPFPEGTIIARLAWSFDSSEENNKLFGTPQSFVAGGPKNGGQFLGEKSKK